MEKGLFMIDMRVKIGKTTLKTPIIGASGCSGWGVELSKFNDFEKIGGFVTKSITLKKKVGNQNPRIREVYGGILNSIGLENNGVEYFIENILPQIKNYRCAKFLNLAPFSKDDLVSMIKTLDSNEGFDGYEVNISCPNISNKKVNFNSSFDDSKKLLKGIRKLTEKTLLLKLSPSYEESFKIAKFAEREGFDGISFTNTYIGTLVDVEKREFVFKNIQAGFSGPAIKPLSLFNVYKMVKSVKIPVIGIGGITTLNDLLDFLVIGATACQIGTGVLVNPGILEELSKSLEEYMKERKIKKIKEIIGSIKERL